VYSFPIEYCSLFSIELGEHLPLHSDGILLHPDTMRECDIVIASPVVVRTFADNSASSSRKLVHKAWPLTQLPLDGWYIHITLIPRDLTLLFNYSIICVLYGREFINIMRSSPSAMERNLKQMVWGMNVLG
jgi:hypothetical protein